MWQHKIGTTPAQLTADEEKLKVMMDERAKDFGDAFLAHIGPVIESKAAKAAAEAAGDMFERRFPNGLPTQGADAELKIVVSEEKFKAFITEAMAKLPPQIRQEIDKAVDEVFRKRLPQ